MDATDISLPYAEDSFYNSFGLASALPEANAPNPQQTHATSAFYLTNLHNKLKAHMQYRHKLGSANTSKYQYTSWQRLKEIMLPSSLAH